MKRILRNILINALALFVTSLIFKGLILEDVLLSATIGGAVLTLMNLTIKPILSIITLPFNFLTLGGFSWVITIAIMYLLTVVVPTIKIASFTFEGTEIAGFVIPEISFTYLTGLIAVSLIITFITGLISWLIS